MRDSDDPHHFATASAPDLLAFDRFGLRSITAGQPIRPTQDSHTSHRTSSKLACSWIPSNRSDAPFEGRVAVHAAESATNSFAGYATGLGLCRFARACKKTSPTVDHRHNPLVADPNSVDVRRQDFNTARPSPTAFTSTSHHFFQTLASTLSFKPAASNASRNLARKIGEATASGNKKFSELTANATGPD